MSARSAAAKAAFCVVSVIGVLMPSVARAEDAPTTTVAVEAPKAMEAPPASDPADMIAPEEAGIGGPDPAGLDVQSFPPRPAPRLDPGDPAHDLMLRERDAAGAATDAAPGFDAVNAGGGGAGSIYAEPAFTADRPYAQAWGTDRNTSGDLFIADSCNRIVKRTAGGTYSSFAGAATLENCIAGNTGDGGPKEAATFNFPTDVAHFGGTLYVADHMNNRIRKISPAGNISHFAFQSGPTSLDVDASGNLYAGSYSSSGGYVMRYTPAGVGTYLDIQADGLPLGMNVLDVALHQNALYLTDGDRGRVLRYDLTTGITTRVAGRSGDPYCTTPDGDGGPATAALVCVPWGLVADSSGNIYYGDSNSARLRKIDAGGMISTVGGGGSETTFVDGMPATLYRSIQATHLDLAAGALWVSASHLYRIDGIGQPVGTPIGPTERNSPSGKPVCLCEGDPVDSLTGALHESSLDLVVPGRGPGLSLSRSYASTRSSVAGALGYGWIHSYETSLTITLPTVTVNEETGSSVVFTDVGGGAFTAPPRVLASLVRKADGTYAFTRKDGSVRTFTAAGKLKSIADRNGYTTTVNATGSSTVNVTDAGGRTLALAHDAAGRLVSATDPVGRKARFTYDAAGNLAEAFDVRGGREAYTYDGSHRLLTITDPRGGVTTNHYDASGRVDWQIEPRNAVSGAKLLLDYTSIPGATKVTNAAGDVELHRYTDGLLVEQTRGYGTPDAATWTYGYDARTLGRAWTRDPNGVVVGTGFDSRGNMTATLDGLGRTTRYTYNAFDQVLTSTDGNGHVRTRTYDATGNLLTDSRPKVETGEIQRTTYAYDPAKPGDLRTVTDGAGKVWGPFAYDAYGQMTTYRDPLGNTTTNAFDLVSRKVVSVAANGNASGGSPQDNRTAMVRDDAGNVILELDALGRPIVDGFSRADATSLGSPDTSRAPLSGPSWQATAGIFGVSGGRAYLRTAPSASSLALLDGAADGTVFFTEPVAQDNVGVAFRAADANNYWKLVAVPSYTTWALQKVVGGVITPVGHTGAGTCCQSPNEQVSATFTGSTIVVRIDGIVKLTVTDSAMASNTKVGLFALQQGVGRIDSFAFHRAGGGSESSRFDPNGSVASTTDARGNTVSMVYDAADDLTQVNRADGSILRTGYDAVGRTVSQTDGDGKVTSTTFDRLGRIRTTRDPLLRTTTYGYDGVGNVRTITDHSGRTTTQSIDAANQLTGIDHSDPATPDVTAITYDGVGRRTGMTDASGTSTYTYDSLDQLKTAKNGAGSVVTYGWDLAGRIVSIGYPGEATPVVRRYDAAGRMDRVTDFLGRITNFAYDPNGNLRTQTNPNNTTVTYNYDVTDRSTSISHAKAGTPFALFTSPRAPGGLVTSTTGTGTGVVENTGYGYDVRNRVSTVSTGGTYGFDAADNLRLLPSGAVLSFDVANQLSSVTGGPAPASYTYTTQGQRATRTAAGTTTNYSWNQAGVLTGVPGSTYVYNADGLRMRKTVWGTTSAATWDGASSAVPLAIVLGGDRVVYGPDGLPLSRIQGTTVTTIGHDQLGSTRVLTNAAGDLVGTYTYDAYGRTTAHTGAVNVPLRFAGEYYDGESDLYYLRARYYEPATGQFLSRDAMVADSRSAYGYAGGQPLNATDPTGNCWFGNHVSWLGEDCRVTELREQLEAKKPELEKQLEKIGKKGVSQELKYLEGLTEEERRWAQRTFDRGMQAIGYMEDAYNCLEDGDITKCGETFVNNLASIGLKGLGPCGAFLFDMIHGLLQWSADVFYVMGEAIQNKPK